MLIELGSLHVMYFFFLLNNNQTNIHKLFTREDNKENIYEYSRIYNIKKSGPRETPL